MATKLYIEEDREILVVFKRINALGWYVYEQSTLGGICLFFSLKNGEEAVGDQMMDEGWRSLERCIEVLWTY